MADHRSALLRIIELLTKSGRFGVKAIGHRIVHGGEYFQEAVIVTEDVIEKIEELARLAPLHNRPNAQGIRIAAEIFPGKPQVAVFDTGFRRMLPPYAFHYPIPYEYYERHRVPRYGFHGTSHHYVTYEAARRLGKPLEQVQFISAHPVMAVARRLSIRAQVLTHLAILKPVIDSKLTEKNGRESNERSSTESGLLCLVIATNEELMIARETDSLTS